MPVVKVIELLSSSEKSWEDATEKAVKEASATLKNLRSAWVKDQSVTISNGKVTEYRVTLKVSFELE